MSQKGIAFGTHLTPEVRLVPSGRSIFSLGVCKVLPSTIVLGRGAMGSWAQTLQTPSKLSSIAFQKRQQWGSGAPTVEATCGRPFGSWDLCWGARFFLEMRKGTPARGCWMFVGGKPIWTVILRHCQLGLGDVWPGTSGWKEAWSVGRRVTRQSHPQPLAKEQRERWCAVKKPFWGKSTIEVAFVVFPLSVRCLTLAVSWIDPAKE